MPLITRRSSTALVSPVIEQGLNMIACESEPRSKASTLGPVSAHRRTTSNGYVSAYRRCDCASAYCGFRPAASTALR